MTRIPQKTNPLVTGLVIGLGFAVCGAQAVPPAMDAVSSGSANTPLTITVSHTTTGTDRLMLVGVSHNNSGGETVSSVTYNGVSLDFVGQNANSATRIEIWKLVAPPTVTANVVVTFSATLIRGAVVGVMTFTGVDQTTPLGTYAGNAGATATATIDVASAADELVFGVVAGTEDACPITVGGGQFEWWSDTVAGKPCAAGSTEAGAATVTISWSLSTGDNWSIGGISIKPGGAGAVTVNYRSIGTDSSVLYAVGNASINSGTSVVTFGGGASLPTNVGLGDKLEIGGGSSTLFSDDFNDGVITGWTKIGGADTLVESAGLFQTPNGANTTTHYSVDAGAAWTDYTFSADVKPRDTDVSGITFRVQDANNYYLLRQSFGGAGNWQLYLQKVVVGAATDLATVANNNGSNPGQVASGTTFYQFKVELSGTSIKAYIDGVLKFDITDSTYSTGTVGLWLQLQRNAEFDNALVTGGAGAGGDFHILSRDSDTQVTVQGTAGSTVTNETYTIERAYNTLQAWETARDGDLVSQGYREVGVCYNDPTGPFTGQLKISGSTTSVDNYMHLTVAEGHRHNGIAGGGARLDAGTGLGVRPVIIRDQYTRVEWLEITNWLDGYEGVYFDEALAIDNSDNSSASNLLIHNFLVGAANGAIAARAANITIRNTIIYDGDGDGIHVRAGGSGTIENCTVYGIIGTGIYQNTGTTVSIRNTISVGNTSQDFFLEGTVADFDYNMYTNTLGGFTTGSNDKSPPGDPDNLFISITVPVDLHIEATGHSAGNTGLDLSADFVDDIDGVVRTGTWDIGADEGVPGTTPPKPKIVRWREVDPY